MKKKFSHVIAHYLPQCLLLISLLTSNVLFPITVIAQEIENTNNVIQEETVPIDTSEDILEEGISTSIYEEEEVVEPPFVFENGIYTVNTVVEGEEYVYPDNNNVRVKFTEVTQEGNLVIKRVELTEEQKELLNTKDSYGWDITSSMKNGTFKYNLTLPNTQGNNDIEVKYTEDGKEYESIDNSNIEIKSNVVTIEGLDHFTVFVVVNPLPDNYTEGASNCTIMTGSICYDTIQEAVTAATSGDTINVLAGEYHENITINKSLSLMGVGEGNKPTIVGGVIISTSGAVSIENMNFKVPSVTSVDSIHINNVDGELQLHVKNCSFDGSSQFLNGKRGIQSDDSQSKVTVEGSTFSNGYYIAIQGKYNELNISNSTISNCKSGINFQSGNNLSVTDTNISVVAQTISNDTYAVRFASDGTNTGNKMTLNGGKYVVDKNGLIADSNTYHSAIIVRSGASGVLKANNLSLGGEVVNLSGQKLDATKNWWGDLDPSDNIKNSGTGSIDYSPWWGEDYANDDHSSAWTWYTNDSIQEAVNVATSGDIVNVKAGTYYERVVINKSLRLYGVQANVDPRPSVGGRNGVETIVNGNGSQILQIDADDVEINGFEFVNGGGYMIEQIGSHSNYVFRYNIVHNQKTDDAVKVRVCTNCLVSNNYIYDIASPGDGIGLSGGTNSAIRNNELVNQSSENAAIYVYDSTNTSITGNIVNGTTQNDGIKLGHKKGYNAEGVGGEIKNNVVSDTAQDGISVYMSNVVVDGNEISGSSSTNGALYLAFGISNVTITNNKIHDNTSASGIKIESRVNASTVTINNNQIFNNTNYGLYNFANTLLNAKSNWWGDNDNSGPYDEWSDGSNPLTNLTGNGNSVRGMVDYSSWIEADKTIPNTTSPRMFVSHDGGITFEERTYVTKGDIVRVETDATDNLSGIDYVQFSIKNPSGGYVANYEKIYAPISTGSDTYRFEFTIPADGKYIDTHELITEDINGLNFWVRAYDNAGNYNHGTSNTFTYDKTQPTISEPRMYVSRNGQPYKLSNTVKPGDRVKVQAEAEDSSSGIRSVEFRIQDKSTGEYIAPRIFEETPISGNTYEYIFQIPTDGKYINTHNPISEEYLQLSYWVRAHDIVGNYAHGAFDLFTLDTTDPSVPTNGSPNNSIISTNDFDFTWDVSTDVSTITYEFQSSLNPSQVDGVLTTELFKSETLTTNNIHSSGASDGTWYWQVRAKDAAGNYSDWSEIWTVTIDTTPPTIPQNLRFENPSLQCGDITNNYNITPTWNESEDMLSGLYRYEYFVNTPGVQGWTIYRHTNSYPAVFNQGEGKYTFKVRAIDNVNNISAWSNECTITYDKTPAEITITPSRGPDIGQWYSTRPTYSNTFPTFEISTNEESQIEYKWNDGTWNTYTETEAIKHEENGKHILHVRATDLAGNTTEKQLNVWQDFSNPEGTFTINDNDKPVRGTLQLNFTDVIDPSGSEKIDRIEIWVDGSGYQGSATKVSEGVYKFDLDTEQFDDGNYTIRPSIFDMAGNRTRPFITITIDNTPPVTPTATLTANGISVLTNGYTSSEKFTFNLSSSEDTTRYQLKYWNNIPTSRFKENSPWNPTDLRSYSSELGVYNDKFTQGEGKHYFVFSACDMAGNCSGDSTPFVVTYDKTAPRSTITSPSSGYITKETPEIIGNTTDGYSVDKVVLSYTDYNMETLQCGETWTELKTIENQNKEIVPFDWSYNEWTLGDGFYCIKVSATDIAGNIEQDTYISSLTYDSTAPSITVFNIVSDILNISANDLLSGTDKVEVKINDGEWISYTTDMNLNTILNNTPGTYTIYVKVTDKAGNTTEGSTTYTIPQPAPAQAPAQTPATTVGAVLGATTGPTTTTTKTSIKGTTTTKTTPNISEDIQTEELLETTSIEEQSVLGERCENKKKVSGYVYIDENKDKEMNDNEKGIKDITITIQYTDEEGNIKTEEEVSTDEKGYWETQLCSGKYNIVVKQDTLPKNIEVPEVLSLTVSDNEKETIFNIQALDTRNFWQKYWYLIVGGLAIIVIGYSSIKNRKKEEI